MRRLCFFCAAAFSSVLFFSLCFLFVSQKHAYMAAFIPVFAAFFLTLKKNTLSFISGAVFGFFFIILYLTVVTEPCGKICKASSYVSVRATSCAEGKGSYGRVEGRLISLNGEKAFPYKAEIILNDASPEGIYPGCRIDFYAKAEMSGAASLQKGFVLKLSERDGFTVTEEKGGVLCAVLRLSYRLRDRINLLFKGDDGGLLTALLCGDKSYMSKSFKESLYKSGLSHIAAVSGLHVSVIAAVFITLFGKKRGFIAVIAVLPFYAVITGASPSVLRASVMSLLFIAAFLFDSQYDRFTALSFSALFIGLLNPFSVCSPSFALSFSATLGIMLLCSPISSAFNIKPRGKLKGALISFLISAFSVTLSALVFTLPVSMLYFRSVSMLSLISNPLVLWAVAPAMFCGAITLVISFILPALAGIFVFISSVFLKYIVFTAGILGSLSFTARCDDLFTALFCLSLTAAAVLFLRSYLSPLKSLALSALIFALCFVSSYIKTVCTYEINIFGDENASAVVIYDGKDALSLNLPSSYGADMFFDGVFERFGISSFDAAVLSGTGYKNAGNADKADYICAPDGLWGENVLCFNDGGSFSFKGVKCAVLNCGGEYALFARAGRLSIIDVCSVTPYKYAKEPFDIKCDILIINAKWARSEKYLSALCSRLRPFTVLVSTSDYDYDLYIRPGVCGCEYRLLNDADYYEIRYLK